MPHPARVYDYWLGGKDNSRPTATRPRKPRDLPQDGGVGPVVPRLPVPRGHLPDRRGRDQAVPRPRLGLPSAQNVHEVAQSIAPESRVVYVDHDPVVMLHARRCSRARPRGRPATSRPTSGTPTPSWPRRRRPSTSARRSRSCCWRCCTSSPTTQDPAGIIRAVMDAVPPGSYLAIGHHTADIDPRCARSPPACPSLTRPSPPPSATGSR